MIKKIIAGALIALTLVTATTMPAKAATITQDRIHDVADILRGWGFKDDSRAIQALSGVWWDEQMDLEILTTVIYNECGCCTDEQMEWQGATVMNRVNDPRFDNTIYDVVTAPGQFLPAYAKPGSYYWNLARATDETTQAIYARCKAAAEKAMNGETDCPSDVVWQANFRQGLGVAKEFYSEVCNSYTYFCY